MHSERLVLVFLAVAVPTKLIAYQLPTSLQSPSLNLLVPVLQRQGQQLPFQLPLLHLSRQTYDPAVDADPHHLQPKESAVVVGVYAVVHLRLVWK
jgi:hypothetical protein